MVYINENNSMRAPESYYQLPTYAEAWCRRVFAEPGFYAVMGERNMGKSALLRYLAKEFQRQGIAVIPFGFRPGGQDGWAKARAQIGLEIITQLPEVDLRSIMDSSALPLDLPGSSNDPVRYAVIIDDLHEINRVDYERLDDLLPTQPLTTSYLIIASSLALQNFSPQLKVPPGAAIELEAFDLVQTSALVQHFKLEPLKAIVREVHRRSGGAPQLVSALCWELQRSAEPLTMLKRLPALTTIEQLAEYELDQIEELLDAYLLSRKEARSSLGLLLRRVLGVLAISPEPLPFDELRQILGCDWEELNQLRRLLRAHLVNSNNNFQLISPSLEQYLRQMPQRYGRYASEVQAAVELLPIWFRQRFLYSEDLHSLPLYILRHTARYSMNARRIEECAADEVFARPEWKIALEEHADLEVVRKAVREAWAAAEQVACPEVRVLGVTACAIMATSLGAVLPPEIVSLLVHYGLWSQERAHAYALGYPTVRDRQILRELLQADREPPDAMTDPNYVKQFKQQLMRVVIFSRQEQASHLRQLLQQYVVNRSHTTHEEVIRTLREAHNARSQDMGSTQNIFELIKRFESLILHTHPASSPVGTHDQLSNEQSELLEEIAGSWTSDGQPTLNATRYVELTRMLAGSTRANYFEALRILAPAIIRVFGVPCAQRLAALIARITQVYP